MLSVALVAVAAFCLLAATLHAQENRDPRRFEAEMKRFEEQDQTQPPREKEVIFIGSSSIRKWNVEQALPDRKTVNRGFGGSTIADANFHFDRLIGKRQPQTIVFYSGDNDIGQGKTAEEVAGEFGKFFAAVQKKLPQTDLIVLPIKPSIKRWSKWEEMQKANALIRETLAKSPRGHYADTVPAMLGEDGMPRKELFVADGLHLSAKGYEVWNETLRKTLKAAEQSSG